MKKKITFLSTFILQLISFLSFGQINSNPLSVMISSYENVSCFGQGDGTATAIASGGTGAYTYLWTPYGGTSAIASGLNATNTFTITVTDSLGNKASTWVTIGQPAQLFASISGLSSGCPGTTFTLNAYGNGGITPYTYLWSPSSSTTSGINISPSISGYYTVNITDNNGCIATANKFININPLPPVNFSAGVQQGCAPLCVQFRDLTTGNNNHWSWSFGDGDSVSAKDPIYCYHDSGSYSVTLTVVSDSGCSATLKKLDMITAYGSPHAAYTYTVYSNKRVLFADHSTDAYGLAYRIWNFGDGDTSTMKNPLETYPWGAYYCPTLMVMNIHGCVDTATNCFTIAAVPDISNEIENLDIYPNPADNILNVVIKGGSANANFYLTDILGRDVFADKNRIIKQDYKEMINMETLRPGIYFLVIETNGQRIVRKVTKL